VEIFASQGAPLVLGTLVANSLPVSTTPAVNFATGTACVDDTGPEKNYPYVNYSIKRRPNKIIKTFMIADFFIFGVVSTTPVQ
jgi:hypothetical protein